MFLQVVVSWAQAPEPNGAGVEEGTVPEHWVPSGPRCMEVSDWQVHEYNPNLYIVRQSGCLDYEKPFVYLIFGGDKALMIDTGSRKFPAAQMVQNVVGKWLERNNRNKITLDVVHSHSHGDHVAGDPQLRSMQDPQIKINLIPAELEATKKYYGIAQWPEAQGKVDLGSRILDVIAIPGHDAVGVAIYDRNTGLLFTGDTLYPGRLYVPKFNDFAASVARLVRFTDGKIVTHILGCHVEQSKTAYLDYPVGTIYQPHEHALALSKGDLLELNSAFESLHGKSARLAMRNFSIWPVGAEAKPDEAAEHRFKEHESEQQRQKWSQPLQ